MKFHYFLKYLAMPSEVFLKVTFYLFQFLNCQLFQMKRAKLLDDDFSNIDQKFPAVYWLSRIDHAVSLFGFSTISGEGFCGIQINEGKGL